MFLVVAIWTYRPHAFIFRWWKVPHISIFWTKMNIIFVTWDIPAVQSRPFVFLLSTIYKKVGMIKVFWMPRGMTSICLTSCQNCSLHSTIFYMFNEELPNGNLCDIPTCCCLGLNWCGIVKKVVMQEVCLLC